MRSPGLAWPKITRTCNLTVAIAAPSAWAFDYGVGGQFVCIGAPFLRLRQPSKAVPPEITKVTGITDALVEGQVIDPAKVEAFIVEAALIIAHNAALECPLMALLCLRRSRHGRVNNFEVLVRERPLQSASFRPRRPQPGVDLFRRP